MENKVWAENVLKKAEEKMKAVIERNAHRIPYITSDGKYDDCSKDRISWWTNGFWGGILWEMHYLTGAGVYADLAYEVEDIMAPGLMDYGSLDHDNGFRWLLTSVYHYKLTGNAASLNRSLLAATTMAGRYNPAGRFIRAWNDDGVNDRRGWAIIDCMMNLPLLYWASEKTSDPRFRQVAENHADRAIGSFIREDGSVCHIVEFNTSTGERVRSYGGQGYAHGSAWSRGQAWAIYGFVLSFLHTGKEKYLEAAEKAADFFIAGIPASGLVPIDFRQPEKPVLEDSTAASIAACGMIEIAKASGEDKYSACAVRLLKALAEKRMNLDPSADNLIENGSVAYHSNEHHRGIVYGDYYFLEALMKLAKMDFFPW